MPITINIKKSLLVSSLIMLVGCSSLKQPPTDSYSLDQDVDTNYSYSDELFSSEHLFFLDEESLNDSQNNFMVEQDNLIKNFNEKYLNVDKTQAINLSLLNIEQQMINKVWFSKKDVSFFYDIYSQPIFHYLEKKYQLNDDKTFNDKINQHKSKKYELLAKHYEKTNEKNKKELYNLFKFPMEFEISILNSGYISTFQSFDFTNKMQNVNEFIQKGFLIHNETELQLTSLEIEDLDHSTIETTISNAKHCLLTSNLTHVQKSIHFNYLNNFYKAYTYEYTLSVFLKDNTIDIEPTSITNEKNLKHQDIMSMLLLQQFLNDRFTLLLRTKAQLNTPSNCFDTFEQLKEISSKYTGVLID